MIALEYPCLESLAVALSGRSFEARPLRGNEGKSFGSVVSSGDHHGLDMIEGGQRGVWTLRIAMRASRCDSNQLSKACLIGRAGGWGILTSSRGGSRVVVSVLTKLGDGGARAVIGWVILIEIGT